MAASRAALGLVLLASFASCGYQLWGQPRGLLPHQPLTVHTFVEAPHAGLGAPLAAHLSRMLAADGLRLTPIASHARATLDGTLFITTIPTASRAGITAYALEARVDFTLTDRQGHTLYTGQLQAREDFLPDPSADMQPLTTERQRRFAVGRLAERAARAVHAQLLMALQQAPA